MSTFNRFCAKAKNAARRVGEKTEEIMDSVSNGLKAKSLEIRIDEQYEKLGRLVYRDLHTDDNLEEEKLKVIAEIDALFDRLSLLKKEAEEETAKETPATDEGEEKATQAQSDEENSETEA